MQTLIITGGAGFIGSNFIDFLLQKQPQPYHILCIDNFDSFYNPTIKQKNIEAHLQNPHFTLLNADITQPNFNPKVSKILKKLPPLYAIVHLAAKAGVRPSILQPIEYQKVNITGTQHLLELAKQLNCPQFIFASSSSVYGNNPNVPWNETDPVLQPISPYAATKVAAELIGHVYTTLYNIRFIALRFFTVYGERQRPDLAIHKFTHNIINEIPITLFGNGNTLRDYTYINDIVQGIYAALHYKKTTYEIINLGNNKTIPLHLLITTLQNALQKKAIIQHLPEQAGDVPQTYANIQKAKKLLNYNPQTNLEQGLQKFVEWYKLQHTQ